MMHWLGCAGSTSRRMQNRSVAPKSVVVRIEADARDDAEVGATDADDDDDDVVEAGR